ncbi:MAG: UDP-3-O-(3-hydroxymyristoyl)glucosamine N-acyltransferase [Flavobacteriales bacterium]
MKLPKPHTLKEIANLLNCSFVGSPDHIITGVNEIHVVEPGDIVFVDHPKYYEKALKSAATTVLINKEVGCPEGKGLLVSDDPFKDFNKLTRYFSPFGRWSDVEEANIGEGTIVQPRVTFGKHVTIGKNCFIHSGVIIYDNCVIGDNVIIHANTVIGADAFYYQKRSDGYNKMHTCGRVIIEDNVEIGALCTIDRGVSGDTTIGEGTKLDNQVHIGHDTLVGKHCLFAAQVGIAGCVVIKDRVTLWGQVGIPSNIEIGEGAVVLGQSGVMRSVEGGKTYFGSPADEYREKFRELSYIKKLPEIIEKLNKQDA